MKLTFLLYTLIFLWSAFAHAQDPCNHRLTGKILDADSKSPIPFASIQLSGTEKFFLSDAEGAFEINQLCADKVELIISCFGYCDSQCEHSHQQGKQVAFYLKQKVERLDMVTIQAEKEKKQGTQSLSQSSIGKLELRNQAKLSLASSIANQEGVSFASAGSNVQLPVIHGLYGNRILILNNGLKHGFQNWGAEHAPEIDIATANHITVIKGASGVRFGPEALGGAIIVESNPLHLANKFYLNTGSHYQSNGRGFQINMETGEGFQQWSYFINGSFTKIGDRHSPNYALTNSGKEEKSFGLGTRYYKKQWDVKLYYSYIDQNLALLRTSIAESGNAFANSINADTPLFIQPFSYEIKAPNQLISHHLGKAEINWSYSEKASLLFRMGQQINKRQEYDLRRNVHKPIIDLDLITNDFQLEWKHPNWLQLNGSLGLQVFLQDNDNNPGTDTTPFIPNYNSYRYSAYLIENKSIGQHLMELGLRMDMETNNARGRETNQNIFRDEYQFFNFTSSIGYIHNLSENSQLRTNVGTAWRSPNMAELYSFGQHGFKSSFGLLRYYTNPEGTLKTDRVISLSDSDVKAEKGLKYIQEFETKSIRNKHKITLYANYIQDYIFDRPLAVIGTIRGPMPVFIFDQTDAFFSGVDYNWEKDWSDQFSGSFGLSYLWSKNLSRHEELINQTPATMQYKLQWQQNRLWKFDSSRWTIQARYVFQQFQAPRTISPESLIDGSINIHPDSEIFDFKDAPEAYFLIDLGWHFEWNRLSGSIQINNLFNQSYRNYLNEMRYFADEPGRNLLFSLHYAFQSKS